MQRLTIPLLDQPNGVRQQDAEKSGRPEPTPAPESLLWNAKDLMSALGVSIPTIRRMDAAGKLPKGIRLGGSKKWRRAEIEAWVLAGCPDRRTWQAMSAQSNGRLR